MSKIAKPIVGCFVALATAVLTLPATAQQESYEYIISLAGQQRMLSQRMSKEMVLIALNYNVRENVRNLRYDHEQFDRVLRGLRLGDPELALGGTRDRDVLDDLTRVEQIWPLFDAVVQSTISSGTVSADQLDSVADLNMPLLAAADKVVKTYELISTTGDLFSMLTIAINHIDRQRMLSQQLSKEYFLIAYGHEPEQNRARLAETISIFDESMVGLLQGNFDLKLIPPPTRQIQAQLNSVQRIWSELRPALQSAVSGGRIDADAMSLVASLNMTLLAEITTAVNFYDAL